MNSCLFCLWFWCHWLYVAFCFEWLVETSYTLGLFLSKRVCQRCPYVMSMEEPLAKIVQRFIWGNVSCGNIFVSLSRKVFGIVNVVCTALCTPKRGKEGTSETWIWLLWVVVVDSIAKCLTCEFPFVGWDFGSVARKVDKKVAKFSKLFLNRL